MGAVDSVKIWANSGDAHVLEPDDLYTSRMPSHLAERMPRSEKISEKSEVVHIDGRSFERAIPYNPEVTEEYLRDAGVKVEGREAGMKAYDIHSHVPGAFDVPRRLLDLDEEGVWGEIVYPSIGLWNGLIRDPMLYREGVKVANNWLKETFLDVTSRSVPAAEISVLSVEDAVAETERVAGLGFQAISLPTTLGITAPNWNHQQWEPLWDVCEEAGIVLAIHIGGDAKDPENENGRNKAFGGRGAAVLNYVDTTYGGQRAATMLVASGVLDNHSGLKVLISEGGATWVPFVADRIEEGYRQHGIWVRPRLKRHPRDIMYEQVYASFQHDKTAVMAYTAMGYKNVMWGSDYPHLEGTFGHTQKVLHELFDDVDEATRYRITRGAFLELFPNVGEPPIAAAK